MMGPVPSPTVHTHISGPDSLITQVNSKTVENADLKAQIQKNPSSSVVSPVLFVTAPLPADTIGTPSSTIIDQDVPSASTSPITQEIQAPDIHQGAEEQIQGIQNAQFDTLPLIHNLILDPSFEESSLRDVIPSDLNRLNQSFDNLR
uniref:Uncharacterized protein n=1 Tax=Tanacetum cinerariifolium TaxID=118510 RepID=A0A6L2L7D8_TANCI|nr:hypothetical protein [Tanacetum cinerariifolium]